MSDFQTQLQVLARRNPDLRPHARRVLKYAQKRALKRAQEDPFSSDGEEGRQQENQEEGIEVVKDEDKEDKEDSKKDQKDKSTEEVAKNIQKSIQSSLETLRQSAASEYIIEEFEGFLKDIKKIRKRGKANLKDLKHTKNSIEDWANSAHTVLGTDHAIYDAFYNTISDYGELINHLEKQV